MWTLIRNGGVLSMSFILLTGFTGLAAAFYFALRARKEVLGFIKGMALATLFATLAASCGDVGATLYAAEKRLDAGAELPQAIHLVIAGCAESTSPGILGFAFLALIAMLTAVGLRRAASLPDQDGAPT